MSDETPVQEAATTDNPAAEATPKVKAKRAPTLTLTTAEGEMIPAYRYPMLRRGPQFVIGVNGQESQAANTTFKEYRKAVFEFGGSCFGIDRHLVAGAEYTFAYPEGYGFEPPISRREEDARRAAKLAAKLAANPAGSQAESPLGSSSAGGEGGSLPPSVEAPTAPESVQVETSKKGKKAQR